MPPQYIFQIENLSKTVGKREILKNIWLSFYPGAKIGVLGGNGAGKSTLVKCVMGFYAPTAGTVLVDGREAEITNPKGAQARGLGMVYQHFTLVPSLTGAENLYV